MFPNSKKLPGSERSESMTIVQIALAVGAHSVESNTLKKVSLKVSVIVVETV